MMDEALFGGLLLVLAAALCALCGFMLASQARVVAVQARMLACLVDLAQMISGDPRLRAPSGELRPPDVTQANWRAAPADTQLAMREAVVRLLAEMDRELPARH
jgi:hypothetical protein